MLFKYWKVFLKAICGKVFQIVTAIKDWSDFDKRYKFKKITEAFLKKKPVRRSGVLQQIISGDQTMLTPA